MMSAQGQLFQQAPILAAQKVCATCKRPIDHDAGKGVQCALFEGAPEEHALCLAKRQARERQAARRDNPPTESNRRGRSTPTIDAVIARGGMSMPRAGGMWRTEWTTIKKRARPGLFKRGTSQPDEVAQELGLESEGDLWEAIDRELDGKPAEFGRWTSTGEPTEAQIQAEYQKFMDAQPTTKSQSARDKGWIPKTIKCWVHPKNPERCVRSSRSRSRALKVNPRRPRSAARGAAQLREAFTGNESRRRLDYRLPQALQGITLPALAVLGQLAELSIAAPLVSRRVRWEEGERAWLTARPSGYGALYLVGPAIPAADADAPRVTRKELLALAGSAAGAFRGVALDAADLRLVGRVSVTSYFERKEPENNQMIEYVHRWDHPVTLLLSRRGRVGLLVAPEIRVTPSGVTG